MIDAWKNATSRVRSGGRGTAGRVVAAIVFLVPLVPLVPLVASTGCVSGAGDGTGRSPTHVAELQPGVDAARAFLTLDEIVPRPTLSENTPPGPLSARATAQITKADHLIAEQRYTEAAIELERALRYDPNHPVIHRTLATLHWEAGNLERARTHANKALQGYPDDATARYILGRYHEHADNASAAAVAYRTALLSADIGDHPVLAALCRHHLATVLASQGYLSAALEQYEAFETRVRGLTSEAAGTELAGLLGSNRSATRIARANLLEKLGRFGDAADAIAPLVTGGAGDAALASRYVRWLLRAGRPRDALQAAGRLPIEDPGVVELRFEVYRAAGQPERIERDLQAALKAHPDSSELVVRLADMQRRLGRSEAARVQLQRFLDHHADALDVRSALLDTLIGLSRWPDVLRMCAGGIERDPAAAPECEAHIAALASNEQAVDSLLSADTTTASAGEAYLRGLLAARVARLGDAESWLKAAHAARSDFQPARVALARVYLRQYRYDEAIAVAARAEESVAEDAELELILGEIYERLDDVETAERHFQAAIQLNRGDAAPKIALAKLFQQTGRILQAQRQLRALLEARPQHEIARELLAYTYLADRKVDAATQQFEELQRRATTPLVKARSAALLRQLRRHDAAAYRDALLAAMDAHGADVETWLALAQAYDVNRDAAEVQKAYLNALRLDPDNEQAAIGAMSASRQLLQWEDAARRMEQLLRRRPNRHAWRLGISERGGRRDSRRPGLIPLYWALQDYDSALRTAGAFVDNETLDDFWREKFRQAVVDTLRFADREAEALATLESWVDDDPDNETFAAMLANEYMRKEQPERALPLYERLHEVNPNLSTVQFVVAALVAAGRAEAASRLVVGSLTQDPENDNRVARLARVAADDKRLDDALELIDNHLLRTLNRQRFQDLAVRLLAAREAYDRAISRLDALLDQAATLLESAEGSGPPALQRPPDLQQLLLLPNEPFVADRLVAWRLLLRDLYARALLSAGRLDDDRRLLRSWLDDTRDPRERFRYLILLADCHRRRGDEESAGDALIQALALQPRHPTLNNDVAYGWIDQGIRLDEAEPMIRYALAGSPRQSAYLDTYGWLLYKKGECREAAKWLRRANHARRGKDPVILGHLGDTLWRLEEHDAAVEHWRKAIAAGEDLPEGQAPSGDQRRILETAQKKLDAAAANRTPPLAPLGRPKPDEPDAAAKHTAAEKTGD